MSPMTVRRARKPKIACGGNCTRIRPGQLYIEHTAFPGADNFYYAVKHPVRLAECRRCAERYGRGPLFDEYEHRQEGKPNE